MIKKLVEAPFELVAWFFKNTYGRVVGVLLITVLAVFVNYPIQNTPVGIWEVEDVLTEEVSDARGRGRGGPSDVDSATGRVDRTAVKSRKVIGRRTLYEGRWLALITLPFHHVSEREVQVLSENWDKERKHWIKRRLVEWTAQGLSLGLDLRGGTEIIYRIVAPGGAAEETFAAQDIVKIIRSRIDAYGLKEPRVQREGRDRVLIQIPGSDASDVSRIKKIIDRTGRLEFRLVADEQEHASILRQAARLKNDPRSEKKAPDGWHWYTLRKKDAKPGETETEDLLISDQIGMAGEDVERVSVGYGGRHQAEIAVNLTFKNPDKFWALTKDNVNRRLAIVLDDVRSRPDEANPHGKLLQTGRVHSAPVITEPIFGQGQITGGFTQESAEELKLLIQSGSLRTPLKFESEQYVGPYQGQAAIEAGKFAIIIGFVAVVVFMVIYYFQAGLVADIALFLNLLLLVAALALRGATLTLPGIAGIILTIGMSVDANVLIFERIREELKKVADKPLLKCIQDGHHKALVTIVDANLTTLITAVILYEFGSGPVRGFAITLSYGIIISMFTAIVMTRILLEALIRSNLMRSMPMLEAVRNPNIPFIGLRRLMLTVSAVVVVAGLVAFFAAPGDRFGIEFSSGTRIEVNLKGDLNAEAVRASLKSAGYPDVEVQEVSAAPDISGKRGRSSFAVRLRYVSEAQVGEVRRFEEGKYPGMKAGIEALVHVDRKIDTAEMAARLAALGSAGCVVEEGPKSETEIAYVVRSPDTSPDAVRDFSSNVKAAFGDELLLSDIRRAFTGSDGKSLLVDEGVRLVPAEGGGSQIEIALRNPASPADLARSLESILAGAELRPVEAVDAEGKASRFFVSGDADTLPKVKDALRAAGIPTLEPFASISRIGPATARELGVEAAVALGLALLAIVAYIWFRFEFRFGLAAVIALVHDVAITLGALALTGREISLTVIAALLTIIGYSLNDTIVIFDRIRENRRTVRKTSFPDIINLSINQTLSRTVLTSVTTLLAVMALFFFGGPAIEDFAFTLLVGVVVGTYSSVFIASPILLMTGEQGALRGPLGATAPKISRPLEGFRAQ